MKLATKVVMKHMTKATIYSVKTFSIFFIHTGLKIHFDEEYYISEKSGMMGSETISLSVSKAQETFVMELIPATVDVASTQYNLSHFSEVMAEQQAVPGEVFTCDSCTVGF